MTAFFHMGGYAWFVWPAFAITLVALIGLAVVSAGALKRRQSTLAALGDRRGRPPVAADADPSADAVDA
ncbi:MAG: heme exporter protein CcmD [Rhodospirillales bacterium]